MHPSRPRLDESHDHPTWISPVRAEYTDDGRLHRHTVLVGGRPSGYTTWANNTGAHAHRLPDGAWTRPRRDLGVPRLAQRDPAGRMMPACAHARVREEEAIRVRTRHDS